MGNDIGIGFDSAVKNIHTMSQLNRKKKHISNTDIVTIVMVTYGPICELSYCAFVKMVLREFGICVVRCSDNFLSTDEIDTLVKNIAGGKIMFIGYRDGIKCLVNYMNITKWTRPVILISPAAKFHFTYDYHAVKLICSLCSDIECVDFTSSYVSTLLFGPSYHVLWNITADDIEEIVLDNLNY